MREGRLGYNSSVTLNTPLVRVPVLSNTTISVSERISRKFPPLTRIPSRDAIDHTAGYA